MASLDLLTQLRNELSGSRAASYSALSDAAAASVLAASGFVNADVPVGAVEGYLRGKGMITAFEDWLSGALVAGATVLPQPTGTAKTAIRELLGIITGKVLMFELSDPDTFATVQGMMEAIVTANGPFTAQHAADIVALAAPVVPSQQVTCARVLNTITTVAAPGQPNSTSYGWTWTQSAPSNVPPGQSVPQNANLYVTITVSNPATGETQVGYHFGIDISQTTINKQAAAMIASLVTRDATRAAFAAG